MNPKLAEPTSILKIRNATTTNGVHEVRLE